jgi:hypothetical protein
LRHFAFNTDPLNINESPILSKEAVGEVEYIMKLKSSCHTQRLDGVMARDRMISSHLNTFKYPALFVGELNSTNTLEPSLENTAELSTGGEGSWSVSSTSNIWPRGYPTWQVALDGPDKATASLYLPGDWRTYTDDRFDEDSVLAEIPERNEKVFGMKALTFTALFESTKKTDKTTVKFAITEEPVSTTTAEDTSWEEENWVEERDTRTRGIVVGEKVGFEVGNEDGIVVGETDGKQEGNREGGKDGVGVGETVREGREEG